jgi:hypothetical protein
MASASEFVRGDLVFSRTGCAGIVMNVIPLSETQTDYIIMWTIIKNGAWKFNEQLRDRDSFSRG